MASKTNTVSNGYQYYRITRTIGHKDGKPVKKQFCGRSKGEAEKKYKKFLEKQAEAKYAKERSDLSTFHERAEEFIANSLSVSRYAQGTKSRYESAYRCHIENTWLDEMVVTEIKPSIIQKFYNELVVSQTTIKNINKFMSVLYKWMALNDYSDNVLTAVTMPQKGENKRHDGIVVWDDEEQHTLAQPYFDFRADFMVKLMSYSGMRISEALGLKYGDIENGIIHLQRQWYMGEIKPPKYNSVRDIPMHDDLVPHYERHKAWHEEEMKKNKYKTDYVFTTSTGNLYSAASLRKSFMRFYKRIGVPYKHFHAYRATFCTNMCRAGVPLEITSSLMGHKSLEVTAQFYALIRQDSKVDSINKLKL